MAAQAIPDGYGHVIPYLIVQNVPETITFLERALGAEEIRRTTRPDGSIGNVEMRIGPSVVMMAEARPEWPSMPGHLYLYVEDTDAAYHRAIEAGGESMMEPADQFYGDRNAGVRDPSGNTWWIATHIEDLSDEELQRRSVERDAQQAE